MKYLLTLLFSHVFIFSHGQISMPELKVNNAYEIEKYRLISAENLDTIVYKTKSLYDINGNLSFSKTISDNGYYELWLKNKESGSLKWDIYTNTTKTEDKVFHFGTVEQIHMKEDDSYIRTTFPMTFTNNLYFSDQIEGVYVCSNYALKYMLELANSNPETKEALNNSTYLSNSQIIGSYPLNVLDQSFLEKEQQRAEELGNDYTLLFRQKEVHQDNSTEIEEDKYGNWTYRESSFIRTQYSTFDCEQILIEDTVNVTEKRLIKYIDGNKKLDYHQIICDTLLVNGKLIVQEELSEEESYRYAKYLELRFYSKDYLIHVEETAQGLMHKRNTGYHHLFPVTLYDLTNKRLFIGSSSFLAHNSFRLNWKEYKEWLSTLNHMPKPYKTGNEITLNGFRCDEYIIDDEKGKEYYYITEKLPFIPFDVWMYHFPGLVMKSIRFDRSGNEITYIVKPEKISYPAFFIEYMEDAKSKYDIQLNYFEAK